MAVPSMILCLVFLPCLAALPHRPLMVNVDGKGALVKEHQERPLVRVERSGKQTANEIEPTTHMMAILDDGMPTETHSKVGHDTNVKIARKQHPKVETLLEKEAILDGGMPKEAHSKAGHDTNAKMMRKQHPKVETLLEKEDATSVSLNAETSGVMSAVPKDKPSDHKQRVSWDTDEDDGQTDLDELEVLTIATGLRAKNDPPPEDCVYNSWIMSGSCKGSGCSCSCTGEQEYTRSKRPENWGGRPCTESDTKTEMCQLPACPPTPAPTPPPTAPATTTTLAFATRTGSINLFSWLGLFTAVMYNIR